MSPIGLVFLFVFLQNLVFAWYVGIPLDTPRPRKGRYAVAIMLSAVSLLTAMGALLLSRLAWRFGVQAVLPLLILSLGALLFLLAEAAVRRFSKEKPPIIREWAREAEASGVAFAVALAVSSRSLSLPQALLASLASLGGYFAFAWAFRGILERLRLSTVPRSMRGVPVILLSAGLLSFAFMAIDSGLISLLGLR